jgi:hypothetical protein
MFQGSGDGVPAYLVLLGPRPGEPATVDAISATRTCATNSGANLDSEVSALLAQPNWRAQIVGATSIVLVGPTERRLAALWDALSRPSWISPQLAATAAHADREFAAKAHVRIAKDCAVSIEPAASMNWVARHTALGPGSIIAHSAKLLSSLLALCLDRSDAPWARTTAEDPRVKELLAQDVDRGGQIAKHWLGNMSALTAR